MLQILHALNLPQLVYRQKCILKHLSIFILQSEYLFPQSVMLSTAFVLTHGVWRYHVVQLSAKPELQLAEINHFLSGQ